MKLESLPSKSPALRLIEFSNALGAAPLPQSLVEQAKGCLLDALGCGLFGSGQPWAQIMAEEISAERPQGACTIYGHSGTTAAAASIIHPGTVIVPAVVAAAESADATGERLLRGIIAGYEAMSRLSLALGLEPSHRGFHKTSVVGPVAAAIAAGVVMDLPTEQLSCAVGLACSTASGIKSFAGGSGGGMVKRMHAGRAAAAGVRMSQLARRGFTGPAAAVDGRFGLLEVFGGQSAEPDQLWQALGERWAINEVWVKVYPVCGWIQGVVQLLLALRGPQPLEAARIRKVTVATSEFAVKYNGNKSPSDTMEAQYSIPYCVAVALTADAGDPHAFSLEAIKDPVRRAIAERVEVCVDPQSEAVYPKQFGSRVLLHLDNGEVKEAATLDPHGTAADPCTGEERIAKFTRLAGLSPLKRDPAAIVAAVQTLDMAKSARELGKLLRN
ncbi:MAG: MmgE/PrpD family protein [Betaproteobacteria bacterium]|nr:MmgE/PrpD family protein [Betaproteobacteria bacterium]